MDCRGSDRWRAEIMSRYRIIYNKISSVDGENIAPELLREQGVDVHGDDEISISRDALFVSLQEQINELKAQLDAKPD